MKTTLVLVCLVALCAGISYADSEEKSNRSEVSDIVLDHYVALKEMGKMFFDAVMDNFKDAWTKMKGHARVIRDVLLKLLPSLREILDKYAPMLLEDINDLNIQQLITDVMAFAKSIGKVLSTESSVFYSESIFILEEIQNVMIKNYNVLILAIQDMDRLVWDMLDSIKQVLPKSLL